MPKTSEDTLVADSPSLASKLLIFDNASQYSDADQQHSPLSRLLSDLVAPIDVNDQPWADLFDFTYQPQYPIADSFDFACSNDQAIDHCFDMYPDPFFMLENEFY